MILHSTTQSRRQNATQAAHWMVLLMEGSHWRFLITLLANTPGRIRQKTKSVPFKTAAHKNIHDANPNPPLASSARCKQRKHFPQGKPPDFPRC